MPHAQLLCDNLLELALAQREAIVQGDIETYLRLADQRETAMSRFTDAFATKEGRPGADTAVTSATSYMVEALERLVRLDTEMSQALLERMDEVRRQITDVRTERTLSARYNPLPVGQQAQFFDHVI